MKQACGKNLNLRMQDLY